MDEHVSATEARESLKARNMKDKLWLRKIRLTSMPGAKEVKPRVG